MQTERAGDLGRRNNQSHLSTWCWKGTVILSNKVISYSLHTVLLALATVSDAKQSKPLPTKQWLHATLAGSFVFPATSKFYRLHVISRKSRFRLRIDEWKIFGGSFSTNKKKQLPYLYRLPPNTVEERRRSLVCFCWHQSVFNPNKLVYCFIPYHFYWKVIHHSTWHSFHCNISCLWSFFHFICAENIALSFANLFS